MFRSMSENDEKNSILSKKTLKCYRGHVEYSFDNPAELFSWFLFVKNLDSSKKPDFCQSRFR